MSENSAASLSFYFYSQADTKLLHWSESLPSLSAGPAVCLSVCVSPTSLRIVDPFIEIELGCCACAATSPRRCHKNNSVVCISTRPPPHAHPRPHLHLRCRRCRRIRIFPTSSPLHICRVAAHWRVVRLICGQVALILFLGLSNFHKFSTCLSLFLYIFIYKYLCPSLSLGFSPQTHTKSVTWNSCSLKDSIWFPRPRALLHYNLKIIHRKRLLHRSLPLPLGCHNCFQLVCLHRKTKTATEQETPLARRVAERLPKYLSSARLVAQRHNLHKQ